MIEDAFMASQSSRKQRDGRQGSTPGAGEDLGRKSRRCASYRYGSTDGMRIVRRVLILLFCDILVPIGFGRSTLEVALVLV